MDYREALGFCPICRKYDEGKNMVVAALNNTQTEKGEVGSWMGKAHPKCIEEYNKAHEEKFSILEYDEADKFLGESTPI